MTVPDPLAQEKANGYLNFFERHSHTRTKKWDIQAKRDGTVLARVKWYGPWRQYIIVPEPDCVFNSGCLMEITTFLDFQMTEWREAKRQERLVKS